MSVIRLIMTIAIIAVSIVMTVVILMQEGRSQGLGAISGAAETYWGKNKGRSMEGFLEKFTTGLYAAVLSAFSACRIKIGNEAECVIICTPAIFCRSVFLCAKQ